MFDMRWPCYKTTKALDQALKERPREPGTLLIEEPAPVLEEPPAPNEPEPPQQTPCTPTTSVEYPAPVAAPAEAPKPSPYRIPQALLDALDMAHAQAAIDEQVKAAQAAQRDANQKKKL